MAKDKQRKHSGAEEEAASPKMSRKEFEKCFVYRSAEGPMLSVPKNQSRSRQAEGSWRSFRARWRSSDFHRG